MTDAPRKSSKLKPRDLAQSLEITAASKDLTLEEFGVYVAICAMCGAKGPIPYNVMTISSFFEDGKDVFKMVEKAIDTLIKQGKLKVIFKDRRPYLWADVLGAEDASD